MSRPHDVVLLGLGGVGQGLLELWSERPDPRFRIVAACDAQGAVWSRDGLAPARLLAAKRGPGLRGLGTAYVAGATASETAAALPHDVAVDLLPCDYESGEPGLSLLRQELEEGRHAVTAEKASLVLGFERLRRSAVAGGAQLRYSACVGGSVPFIPTLEWIRQSTRIQGLEGVLNATTTFLLSELEARRESSAAVLERARSLGILERDPRHDLDGYDLAAKSVLVHNTVFEEPLDWGRAERNGIRPLLDDPDRLRPGTRLVASIAPGRVRTEPRALAPHHPLRVYGLENALLVESVHAGELLVRGVGAGGRGTATNVYGDLVRVALHPPGGEAIRGHAPLPRPAILPHV